MAILIRPGEPARKLHFHLGASTQHTVHEAELVGLLLGLHLIETDKKGKTSYALGADNQAAISALTVVKATNGKYIADELLKTAARIKKTRDSPRYSLTIRWTAVHAGIAGNEEVDGEAKKAAEGLTTEAKLLPPFLRRPLKLNGSALRQQKKSELKKRWKREWNASTRASKYKNIDPSFPSNKYMKLISDDRLSRADISRISQLITGHIPLNAYLERIRRVDSARCPACGHPKENVQHYILECPSYRHERWAMLKHCEGRDPKIQDILNNSKKVVPLANYIQATGLFEQGK